MELDNQTIVVVFGNQLLKNHPAIKKYPKATFLLIEADNLFRKLPYHKHKLVLMMAAMRNYNDYLKDLEISTNYVELKTNSVYKDILVNEIKASKCKKLVWANTCDEGPNKMMRSVCSELGLECDELENLQFVTPANDKRDWFENNNNMLMDKFYRWQRKRMDILLENGKPVGGKWSYDDMNRKPLPKSIEIPRISKVDTKNHEKAVEIIEKLFPDNPGEAHNFWLPTNHRDAELWLEDFIKYKLANFGPYEDAMKKGEAFLFHSVLSPLLNIGLLEPGQVLEKVNTRYEKGEVSINSYEGFVRQIIGWREYMHGLYLYKSDRLANNYFGFNKKLEDWWYSGNLPDDLEIPLKEALNTTFRFGYNHHIERLMVLGNWFLLNSYDPSQVYRWFSSMYVDAYEWVMVPNVYGMSQYADGGFTATKPYISGGNYLQKMGKWWGSNEEAKQSKFTELYWKFLNDNYDKLKGNPRMGLVLAQAKSKVSN